MKLYHCLISVCIAGLLANAGNAETSQPEQTWYEVSLAIFKHKNSPTGNEKWLRPDQLDLSFPAGMVVLSETESASVTSETETLPTRYEDLIAFQNGNHTDKEYGQALASIEISPNYEVLVKNSWRQPALEKGEAIPVLIQAGDEYDGYFELEGSVTLTVSRYLHIKADLWLADYIQQVEMVTPWWQSDSLLDDEPSDFQTTELGTFSSQETITRYESVRTVVLNESRRMRSGELHYLDHPLFGMIVKVTPVKLEPEEPQTDPLALNQ